MMLEKSSKKPACENACRCANFSEVFYRKSCAQPHMFATIASRPYQVVDSGVGQPDGSVRSIRFLKVRSLASFSGGDLHLPAVV
jgi:hypothetical protein